MLAVHCFLLSRSGGGDPNDGIADRRWQQVLSVEVTSDSYMVTEKLTGGETRSSDGLSELTTHQNPNPNNYDLFYGLDIMLRENEYSDFH